MKDIPEYKYDLNTYSVTQEMKDAFEKDGIIIIRGMFDKDELLKLEECIQLKNGITKYAMEQPDGRGRASRLSIWNQPGNDITGMVARCEKIAGTSEKLLGGEIYHYHSKLMMKEPRTGGSHIWHQDYGYWYKNGLLTPDLLTAYIAIDRCVKENGCLQVVTGTHHCGRIDHILVGGQQQADPERVDQLCKHYKHLHLLMEPGDCAFFHSNLLHTADKNDSDMRRYSMLIAYNRADNNPVYKHHHASYTPLQKVPDSAVKDCNVTDIDGKDFMLPQNDKHGTTHGHLVEPQV